MIRFSERQLGIIEVQAGKSPIVDAVYDGIAGAHSGDFGVFCLNVLKFLCQVCGAEGVGARSIIGMVNAYNHAQRIREMNRLPNKVDVLTLLVLVDPDANEDGFRTTTVSGAPAGEQVGQQLDALLDNGTASGPPLYAEFRRIRPGQVGNHRVGTLLFNLVGGTMDQPVAPPQAYV